METIGSIVKILIPVVSNGEFSSKVDTGADNSTIHCDEHYVKDDILYCKPLDLNKTLKFKNFEKKTIKTSDGVEKERYTIKLKVIINGEEIISSFTLNDRNKMDYPILIGKNILKNRFMVDVNKPYIEEGDGNIVRRTFANNISENELTWHRDREDRVVLPINENDWYLQMDNELPKKLNINEEYFIPKNTYHRVIKGSTDLMVEVIKTVFEEDEYEVYEVLEEGKKKKKKKKKDACYYKVRSRYDVWPSAYASGALVKCRKVGAPNWGNSTDESIDEAKKKKGKTDYSKEKEKGLHGWFERRGGGWVDCNTCRKDSETGTKKCKPCGRKEGEERAKYPSCRPTPSSCSTPGKGEKWGKTDESLQNLEKNTIFAENIKEMIVQRLYEMEELTTLGPVTIPDAPIKEPVVLPETPSKPSPRRKRIWETKPASKPKPKM
jgi:hypothetical protein